MQLFEKVLEKFEIRIQNPEPRTQNPELRTHDSELSVARKIHVSSAPFLPFFPKGAAMRKAESSNEGVKELVKKYRRHFHIAENVNHYSKEDYRTAERKFVKYSLGVG